MAIRETTPDHNVKFSSRFSLSPISPTSNLCFPVNSARFLSGIHLPCARLLMSFRYHYPEAIFIPVIQMHMCSIAAILYIITGEMSAMNSVFAPSLLPSG